MTTLPVIQNRPSGVDVSGRRLRVGEWVEVRSKAEILKTLDKNGRLDGMPFMPEMFAFCGKRYPVYKRAHKTCDTVFPVRGRRVDRAVHLDTRCDGQAHGGCQAMCLLFWKEIWLKRVDRMSPDDAAPQLEKAPGDVGATSPAGCSESDIWARAYVSDADGGAPSYFCQATQLPYATTHLAWWDVRQYAEDYWSGNVGLGRMASGFIYMAYHSLINLGIGLGPPLRWLYDAFQSLWGGIPYPRTAGKIPVGERSPTVDLGLQAGDWVRVKSHEEILRTVNTDNKHRGMYWDAELVPYCGGTYRVLERVTQIIDEKTGKMLEMKTPCIILDSVVCQARYSNCRLFCPRSIYPYWREIWLERVEPSATSGNQD